MQTYLSLELMLHLTVKQGSSTIDYYLDAGTLKAGTSITGRRSGAGQGGFDDWFGVAADMYTNGNTFNGDDAVVLYHIDGSIQ